MSFDTIQETKNLTSSYAGIWIKGTVTNNVDPKNLDRVQIEIPGLYESGLGPLPWVGPLKESPFGFGNGYGVFGTPAIGSDVAVWLQNGDPNYPVYVHIQCFPNPGDFPSGQAWGFLDPNGNKLVVHNRDILFTSGGGFVFHIASNGDFTVSTPSGGHGTFNVDNLVFNSQNYTINSPHTTINGSAMIQLTGPTNINGVYIDPAGVAVFPAPVFTEALLTMEDGFQITGGSAIALGVDIGPTHTHSNVRSGTDHSGPVG